MTKKNVIKSFFIGRFVRANALDYWPADSFLSFLLRQIRVSRFLANKPAAQNASWRSTLGGSRAE